MRNRFLENITEKSRNSSSRLFARLDNTSDIKLDTNGKNEVQ